MHGPEAQKSPCDGPSSPSCRGAEAKGARPWATAAARVQFRIPSLMWRGFPGSASFVLALRSCLCCLCGSVCLVLRSAPYRQPCVSRSLQDRLFVGHPRVAQLTQSLRSFFFFLSRPSFHPFFSISWFLTWVWGGVLEVDTLKIVRKCTFGLSGHHVWHLSPVNHVIHVIHVVIHVIHVNHHVNREHVDKLLSSPSTQRKTWELLV